MNQKTISLKFIEDSKDSADKFALEADIKTELQEVKTLIVKSNVLKGAANKRQEEVGNILSEKKLLMKKKKRYIGCVMDFHYSISSCVCIYCL